MNKLPFYFILPIMAILAILNIVAPRKLWRTMASIQFKNPEAMEPSDFAFGMQRVIGVIILGFVVYMFFTQVI